MISSPQHCSCPIVEEGVSLTESTVCGGSYLFMVLLQSYLWGRCDISTPCRRIESVQCPEKEYDFIVVGSGPAGAIVAGRLSEEENFNVLLLEAGGPEPIGAKVPSMYRAFWSNKEIDWRYRTELGDFCLDQGYQGCSWPRGKVLGGSAVLNGMMFHKGHKADYQEWVEAGAVGWSFEELQPYFDMLEGNRQVGTLVSAKYHSANGTMPVQTFNYQPEQLKDLMDACEEAGFRIIDDMNDPNTPAGFTVAQAFTKDGQRYTPTRAYLPPRHERPNLHVRLHTHVTKLVTQNTSPPRVVGVQYTDKHGNVNTVYANKEVILCAGTLNSPQILLLSGIGPAHTLNKFNIPIIADLPVGQNLLNHVGVTMHFRLKNITNTEALNWNALMKYIINRQGPMSATGLTQFTGLQYSSLADQSLKQPDLQFFFNGLYAECSKTGVIGELVDTKNTSYNVTANAVALLPRSTGYLTLQSVDPLEPPAFYPEYFKHPDDMTMVIDAVRVLQKIFYTKVLQDKYEVELDREYTRDCDAVSEVWSDAWIECLARTHTDPQNHQVGTTAIGTVVDSHLRVYNVEGIRVCDAGSIPTIPSGNPQGPIMVVAEKCADLIKRHYA